MWTTPQPSFARLPGIEPRSSSSSPSITRPSGSGSPSTDVIKSKPKSKSKSKIKGKGKESPDSSGSSHQQPPHHHYHHIKSKSPSLPHEEDAGPSGFGTANEDYNTLTEEYLEAAHHTGYDGRVKSVENEGPLVEGSKAWEDAHNDEEAENTSSSATPTPFAPVDGADEFRNVWAR